MQVRTLVLMAGVAVACFAADFAAGVKAYEKGDFAGARAEWEPLADSGSAAAQLYLGLLFYDGRGVPQDFHEARRWFQRAADQGYAKAQHNLGAMYGAGKGVGRDYSQAYKWLSLCSASGEESCVAQRDLVAQKLKGSKLADAQRMAREWKAVPESGKH